METVQTADSKTTQVKKQAEQPVNLPAQELLDALYFFWDGFERATMDFFLVKNTAKQVLLDADLKGDRLTLGVKKNEWRGGQARVFKAYMEHEKVMPQETTDKYMKFLYKNVPVYLYVYDKHPTLDSFDMVFYRYESFNIPNPFQAFEKEVDNKV